MVFPTCEYLSTVFFSDEGALPPPQEVQDRRMMEQLTQMEEKINAEKSREIQDLHTEIEKTKKRYKKVHAFPYISFKNFNGTLPRSSNCEIKVVVNTR